MAGRGLFRHPPQPQQRPLRSTTGNCYFQAVLADSPKSYWRLGESSGTNAVDSSPNAHTGTYHNSPTLGVTGALSGDTNTAITVAAASVQYVQIADNADFDYGNGPFSLELWIKRTRTAASAERG